MNDLITISKQYAQLYKREFIGTLIGGALIVGAAYFYSNWRSGVEQAAYANLHELMQLSQEASKDQQLWQKIEVGAETGFAQHSHSNLAPFFLGLQAEALIRQEKEQQALSLMDSLMKQLSIKSPFYYLYALKHALLQLSQEQTKSQGLEKLEQLAHDAKNPQRDQALYSLGNYYFLHDDTHKAQEAWELLVATYGQEMFGKSPWADLAKSKLAV